jgi:hypothetical protein
MMVRGGFDPKSKSIKRKQKHRILLPLNSSFKIPTWYGVEIKANFDNNEGFI